MHNIWLILDANSISISCYCHYPGLYISEPGHQAAYQLVSKYRWIQYPNPILLAGLFGIRTISLSVHLCMKICLCFLRSFCWPFVDGRSYVLSIFSSFFQDFLRFGACFLKNFHNSKSTFWYQTHFMERTWKFHRFPASTSKI